MAEAPGLAAFTWPVRVYYEDTDAGGVVYYANYLKFMERARTEWLRAHGLEQPELFRVHQVLFVVRAVQIEYLKPALFNDQLQVTVALTVFGRSQIELAQAVERDGVLARATVKVVCVDSQTFKPVAVPPAIRQRLATADGRHEASAKR